MATAAELLPIESMSLADMDAALVSAGVYPCVFAQIDPLADVPVPCLNAEAREAMTLAIIRHLYARGLIVSLFIEVLPGNDCLIYTCLLYRSHATPDYPADIVRGRGRSQLGALARAALTIMADRIDEDEALRQF